MHVVILGNRGQENLVYDILEGRKRLFRLYKQEVQKLEILRFFQRSMVLVQNWSFFIHVFILGNRGQENVFYDILERKKVFLCCKNKKFKKLKN